MTALLAFFPLNILVFPGEKIHLHIFEDRYKQLIGECLEENKTFGIPFVSNSKLMNAGSEVRISKVIQRLANGEMDIEIEGQQLFYLDDFKDPFPGKLYAGGYVKYIENPAVEDNPILINFFVNFYANFYGKRLSENLLEYLHFFDLARLLNFNNLQKCELLELKTDASRHAFFMHQMRFLLLIKEQERKLKNNFTLN